jgi:hypothetical protein
MDRLTSYIVELIEEIKFICQRLTPKLKAPHRVKQSNNVVSRDRIGKIARDSITEVMDDFMSKKWNMKQSGNDYSSNIQAGGNINVNGETIKVKGNNIIIKNGNVIVDKKQVRYGNNSEPINLKIIIDNGTEVKNLNVHGNLTLQGGATIIDNIKVDGNATFNGSRDIVAHQSVSTGGNLTINGNLESSKVEAGGNISAGKVIWQ